VWELQDRRILLILAAAAKRAKRAFFLSCVRTEMKNTRWVELQRVENYDLDPISCSRVSLGGAALMQGS